MSTRYTTSKQLKGVILPYNFHLQLDISNRSVVLEAIRLGSTRRSSCKRVCKPLHRSIHSSQLLHKCLLNQPRSVDVPEGWRWPTMRLPWLCKSNKKEGQRAISNCLERLLKMHLSIQRVGKAQRLSNQTRMLRR